MELATSLRMYIRIDDWLDGVMINNKERKEKRGGT
jgi:hypothetical protein